MTYVVIFIVIVVILYALGARGRGPATGSTSARSGSSSKGSTGKQRIIEANQEWLRERWRLADAEKAAGNLRHFPKWFFDEATDRQRNRLAEDGVTITRSASKGPHSDVIGLFEEPDSEDIDKLKFFGVMLKGPLLNQTRARHEVAKLDSDPEKQRAWLTRPASAIQKEFYRFIGEKAPAELTCEQAEARMNEAQETMTEAQQDEWSALENLIQEFEDRELRNDLEIRKPSPSDIRSAITALKAEGKAFDDPYEIADKLQAIKPALVRATKT